MTWTKLPPIEGGSKGCLCCGALHEALPMEALIAVGFGGASASKDNVCVYDCNNLGDEEDWWTCGMVEELAAQDPDHDWQISYYAPLYDAIYQRQGEKHWVLVKKGEGFA